MDPRFERVRSTCDLPISTTLFGEAFEEPDERIDEGDPEEQFDPPVAERTREVVRRSNVHLVGADREADLEVSGIVCGPYEGIDRPLQRAEVPSVDDFLEHKLLEELVARTIVIRPISNTPRRLCNGVCGMQLARPLLSRHTGCTNPWRKPTLIPEGLPFLYSLVLRSRGALPL